MCWFLLLCLCVSGAVCIGCCVGCGADAVYLVGWLCVFVSILGGLLFFDFVFFFVCFLWLWLIGFISFCMVIGWRFFVFSLCLLSYLLRCVCFVIFYLFLL